MQAAPLNKQDVQKTETQGESKVEQPQPEPVAIPEVKTEPVKPEVKAPATPQHSAGCQNYTNLIAQYNWNHEIATNVMRAESGCNPSAVGDNRVIKGLYAPSCGLFQIRTLKNRPSCEQLHDPETNVAWAYKLYTASGWQPWSVCKTKVRCY